MKGFGRCNSSPKSADLKIQRLSGWAKSNHMSPSKAEHFLRLVDKKRFEIQSVGRIPYTAGGLKTEEAM